MKHTKKPSNSRKKPAKKLGFLASVKNQGWKSRFRNWRFYVLIVGSVLAVWALIILVVGSWYQIKHRNDPTQLGVSFSVDTAKDMGNNWQDNFTALLTDLNIKHFRLMSYWKNIEPEPGKYNFKDLDWQFDQAGKHGADISLAIGIRQPRWPECHRPEWVAKLPLEQQDDALYSFLTAVVNRYKSNPALQDYQLENEVANHMFGACNEPGTDFNRARLTKEANLVKQLDPHHPLDINVSNQSGVPIGRPHADEVGFSIYKKAYMTNSGPFNFYWSFGYVPPLWHSYRAGLVELLHGTPTFVHELQTEPWGPTATKNLTVAEQNKSMTPQAIVDNVNFAHNTGMHRIYLWGSEWWYWRLTKFHDDSLWNTTKQIYQQSNSTGKFNPNQVSVPAWPKS